MVKRNNKRSNRGASGNSVVHQQSGSFASTATKTVTAGELKLPLDRPLEFLSGFIEFGTNATAVASVNLQDPAGNIIFTSLPKLMAQGAINRVNFSVPKIGLRTWASATSPAIVVESPDAVLTGAHYNVVLRVRYGLPIAAVQT
jgi:hypothetical protein